MSLNNMTPKETSPLGQAAPAQSDAPSAEEWRQVNYMKHCSGDWYTLDGRATDIDEMLEAYAALRTAQQDENHETVMKMQAGMFREKTDELKAKVAQLEREAESFQFDAEYEKQRRTAAESALSEARERTLRKCIVEVEGIIENIVVAYQGQVIFERLRAMLKE